MQRLSTTFQHAPAAQTTPSFPGAIEVLGPGGGEVDPCLPCAGAYARVSSEEQKRGRTIEPQLDWMRERNQHRRDVNVAIFLDDGVSGSTNVRIGLRALYHAMQGDQLRELWLNTVDRLCRADEMGSWGDLLDPLRILGVKVVTEERIYDTHNDEDWSGLRDEANEAAKDRLRTIKKLRRGMHGAARRNRKPSFHDPLGRVYDRERREWSTHAGEAAAVRRAAELFRSGTSVRQAVKFLKEGGFARKSGLSWSRSDLDAAFHNPAISGTWTVLVPAIQLKAPSVKHDISIPPIISEEERLAVLAVLDARRIHHGRPAKLEVLFKDLACCGICGGRLKWQYERSGVLAYRCRPCGSKLGRWSVQVVDAAAWARVEDILRDPTTIAAGAAELDPAGPTPIQAQAEEIERLHRKLREQERRVKVLAEQYLGGGLTDAVYAGLQQRVNVSRQQVQHELEQGEAALRLMTQRAQSGDEVRTKMAAFRSVVGELTFAERREIIELFFKGKEGWGLFLYPTGHHLLRGAVPDAEDLPVLLGISGGSGNDPPRGPNVRIPGRDERGRGVLMANDDPSEPRWLFHLEALIAGHDPANRGSATLRRELGFLHTHDALCPHTGLLHQSYRLEAPC